MKRVIFIALASFTFFSCNQSEETSPTVIKNYIPMAIGNYWIYQHYEIDTIGNEEEINQIDSIYIPRDTSINDYTYFIFEKVTNAGRLSIIDCYRDSSGHLLNKDHYILFSHDNYSTFFDAYNMIYDEDTIYTMTIKMKSVDGNINVPAGDFNALNAVEYIYSDNFYEGYSSPRILNNFFANGVGQILDTYIWLGGPFKYERRLLRYSTDN